MYFGRFSHNSRLYALYIYICLLCADVPRVEPGWLSLSALASPSVSCNTCRHSIHQIDSQGAEINRIAVFFGLLFLCANPGNMWGCLYVYVNVCTKSKSLKALCSNCILTSVSIVSRCALRWRWLSVLKEHPGTAIHTSALQCWQYKWIMGMLCP